MKLFMIAGLIALVCVSKGKQNFVYNFFYEFSPISMHLSIFFAGLSLQCYECLKPHFHGAQYPECIWGNPGEFGNLTKCDEETKECSISVQKYGGMGTFLFI